jgi:hypothetical protein
MQVAHQPNGQSVSTHLSDPMQQKDHGDSYGPHQGYGDIQGDKHQNPTERASVHMVVDVSDRIVVANSRRESQVLSWN